MRYWTNKQVTDYYKYCGLVNLEEMGKILGKPKTTIKGTNESLKIPAKEINGIAIDKFKKMFHYYKPVKFIITTSGSLGGESKAKGYRIKLIPWCYIEELIDAKIIDHADFILEYVRIMAMFQRWIHGKDYWNSLTNRRHIGS